ncbi:MAG: 1,4-alpha-glucan branching protein GlgB [Thermoleophilia bacterium]|nr:1,4-alpha-glucan branching protein GlgB [Thermoleophilia bacterium]
MREVKPVLSRDGEQVAWVAAVAQCTPVPDGHPLDTDVTRLERGEHHDPHSVLGAHPLDAGRVAVRAWQPGAHAVAVRDDAGIHRMRRVNDAGLWEAVLARDTVPDYRLLVTRDGQEQEQDDPYRFLPTLGEVDLHLIAEGRHERLWEALGARRRRLGEVEGVAFAVWAPDAVGVGIAGDWNGWHPERQPLRSLGSSGIWELFLPGLAPGGRYKFAIRGPHATYNLRADPLARRTEVPPSTASIVDDEGGYAWGDTGWMATRHARNAHDAPMSIYELHVGSWRRGLGFRELADQLPEYVSDLGYTHVELLPVMEHPFGGSWGYQVSGYYAPTARWGAPDDLRYLVDRLHQAGIGVLLDWVPAHFPRDDFALARFDGTTLYEHPDPRRGAHPDWGTLVFDYGRNEVRNFLVADAVYWLEEFHADGLRVDAVASMLYLDYSRSHGEWSPNAYGGNEHLEAISFLQEVNATVYRRCPGVVMIAEESTAWGGVTKPTDTGGLGFGLKWNMGFMHDSLDYFAKEPVHRSHHHGTLTFPFVYAYSENYVLPISHDEVVHGKGSLLAKMPGDEWQRFANLRAYLAYMWAHPGKKLLFMGCEIAQEHEWSEAGELEWGGLEHPLRRGVQDLVRDLNRLLRTRPALHRGDCEPSGLWVVDAQSADENLLAFLRRGGGDDVAMVANLSPVPRQGYRLALPRAGRWEELLNTDAPHYGGSGWGNLGAIEAVEGEWHGLPAHADITLPPLSVLLFG